MELLSTIGYYSIFVQKTPKSTKYVVDSGKTIYIARFKKYIINPYRDVKEFKSLERAKDYVNSKLAKKTQDKKKK